MSEGYTDVEILGFNNIKLYRRDIICGYIDQIHSGGILKGGDYVVESIHHSSKPNDKGGFDPIEIKERIVAPAGALAQFCMLAMSYLTCGEGQWRHYDHSGGKIASF